MRGLPVHYVCLCMYAYHIAAALAGDGLRLAFENNTRETSAKKGNQEQLSILLF